jgi:Holliday junction DNA helicase RuvA
MIAFLAGTVAHKSTDRIYLDVGGVGYELLTSTRTLSGLPPRGEEVLIYTHLHVRENEVSLFGFASEEEKASFQALIDVSGVGPKVALAVLSTLEPRMLAAAVASDDYALLSSVPGIGKKTAQRLALDLKGKMKSFLLNAEAAQTASALTGDQSSAAGSSNAASSPFAEAQAALFSMGFTPAEISEAFKGADSNADSESLLKHALANLGGGF